MFAIQSIIQIKPFRKIRRLSHVWIYADCSQYDDSGSRRCGSDEASAGDDTGKIVENLDDKLKKILDKRIKEAVPKKEPSPVPEYMFRSAEDLDKAREEDARLEHEHATALFAQYQEQLRIRQDEDSRQTLVVMTALQQELEALKIERNQERETAKNLQTVLVNQVRDLRSTVARPLDLLNRRSHPESGSKPRGGASRPHKRSSTENADGLFAAQLQATLAALGPKATKQPERIAGEPKDPLRRSRPIHHLEVTRGGSKSSSHAPPSSRNSEEALTWSLYVERLWREMAAPVRHEGRGAVTWIMERSVV
jgi:hypothetical protein